MASNEQVQFNSPEELAQWLESLHECHVNGAITSRKWHAAQMAAKGARGDMDGLIDAMREVLSLWDTDRMSIDAKAAALQDRPEKWRKALAAAEVTP